ncbi:ACT domain-containing protein [Gracilibacillus alcaliphilus]|uniref:ACT domain-containing protein n=1 Tax=Gracilibacillus alcaliphilus TaxID=1401441 RepID=UPI00195ED9BD|nr:ACT domain-containing protein [Gracilibacillus alcaliphilus]MBM7676582.1 hypothetical protein [Gracilibacillus alcaliphilus]
MKIVILKDNLSVIKLDPRANPPIDTVGELFSITYTKEECSIVCASQHQFEAYSLLDREDDWRCLKIDGILDFSLTGILAKLSTILADHHISIFALSTFNTDYMLVKENSLEEAVRVLKEAGYTINE